SEPTGDIRRRASRTAVRRQHAARRLFQYAHTEARGTPRREGSGGDDRPSAAPTSERERHLFRGLRAGAEGPAAERRLLAVGDAELSADDGNSRRARSFVRTE